MDWSCQGCMEFPLRLRRDVPHDVHGSEGSSVVLEALGLNTHPHKANLKEMSRDLDSVVQTHQWVRSHDLVLHYP